MREICIGDLSLLFFYFYRKGLIGVWYCSLRDPVKATSLDHPRPTEARPQYKASNIYQPEDWKMQVPSRKNNTLVSCLLAKKQAASLIKPVFLMKKSFVKLEKAIQRAFQANNSAIWDN
jgi:hypothetical protein